MNRKYLLAIGIGLFSFVLIVSQMKGKGDVIRGSLSERAKKYLAVQKTNPASDFANIESFERDMGYIPAGKPFTVGDCFELIIPLTVTSVKNQEKCFSSFTTTNPKGHIRSYMRADTSTSVDDIGDVKMRKLFSEKYEEQEITANETRYLVYTNRETNDEMTAFTIRNGQVFTLVLDYPLTRHEKEMMRTLLNSVTFLN